ncbi:MAG: hypothetical protein ACKN9T_12365 [Candidatus Methylumidiphilus sp.]
MVDGSANIIRVIVGQDDIDLVRRIAVRFAVRLDDIVEASSVREVPGGAYPGISVPYGSLVHVRFDHQPEPPANQLWWRLRQVFLSQMNV